MAGATAVSTDDGEKGGNKADDSIKWLKILQREDGSVIGPKGILINQLINQLIILFVLSLCIHTMIEPS